MGNFTGTQWGREILRGMGSIYFTASFSNLFLTVVLLKKRRNFALFVIVADNG